jgi:flavin-dependent dehydrogenase
VSGGECDVCVAGGGPAGSALAIRLAQLGHTVILIERSDSPRAHVAESLVPAVLPLLDVLGVRGAIEHDGLLQPASMILCWPAISERHDAGFLVDRQAFDSVLLRSAAASGVEVLRPARVASVARRDHGWHLDAVHDGRRVSITCRFVADAAGRSGWLPGRKRRTAPRLLALEGCWRDVPGRGAPVMRVEAGERQWAWGARLGEDLVQATVFADPGDIRQALREAGTCAVYRQLLARSPLFSECLEGQRAGAVRVRDATPHADERPVTADSIKVGDSAFAIDPVSSHGVQTALGSALHAAAVVHTILGRPGDQALALDFYGRCQREAVEFHQRAAGRAYAEIARVRPHDFWQRRARASPPDVSVPEPPRPVGPDTILHVAPDIRVEPGPVSSGDFIVPGSYVRRTPQGRPTALVGGVAIGPLVAAVTGPTRAAAIMERWAPAVEGPRALAILQWLHQIGILRTANAPGPCSESAGS